MICRNHVDVSESVRRCARCGGTYCGDCLVTIQGQPYCAVCKSEQLLDVRSGVDRTHLQFGTVLKRFGSMFLDGIIQAVPIYALMFGIMGAAGVFSGGGKQPNPLVFLWIYPPAFAIPLLYEALMLSMKNGQTVGKMALHLRVVRPDGSPITTGQAWGRAGMRLVLSCFWIVDYLPALFTDEKTTVHDLVAGTRVIDIQ